MSRTKALKISLAGLLTACLVAGAVYLWVNRLNYAAEVTNYAVADDGSLVLTVIMGGGDELLGVDVTENDRTVTVSAEGRSNDLPGTGIGKPRQVTVSLKQPLGGRQVLSDNGTAIDPKP